MRRTKFKQNHGRGKLWKVIQWNSVRKAENCKTVWRKLWKVRNNKNQMRNN